MRHRIALLWLLVCAFVSVASAQSNREYYELRVYYYTGEESEQKLDRYFKNALVPAIHKAGVRKVGVFKSSYHDTSAVRKFVLLIPYSSLNMLDKLDATIDKDKSYQAAAAEYINSPHDSAPYKRLEKTVLKAFTGMPASRQPKLTGDHKERVYELRSYEGATEKLYRTKVKMFNTGDEVGIFDRLGFNAIFYAEVLAGRSMPNLMYMTSFNDMASRDQHWKAFGDDPAWNKLKADKQYDNTVSHIDIWFLSPTEYSDF
jgi:hypothetical protein